MLNMLQPRTIVVAAVVIIIVLYLIPKGLLLF